MTVIYEELEHIAYITINRPELHNAVDPETVIQLNQAWNDYRDNPEIYCAILTGAGNKAFCAGLDLESTIPLKTNARPAKTDAERIVADDPSIIDYAMLRDKKIYKPIIAAVNGFAIAGGMELVQACDIRIASPNAQFGLQEAKWGLFPLGGSTVRLPRQIPYCQAMEIMMTGRLFSAEEALKIGFINRVVPQERLMAEAVDIARTIASNGPMSIKAIKRSVLRCMGVPITQGLSLEKIYGDQVFASEDAKEGPRAFIEKRKPIFSGR